QRDGPALLDRKRMLEGRHRGARGAYRNPAVKIERGATRERSRVGEIGWRRVQRPGLGTIASTGGAVTGGTARLINLAALLERGDLRGNLVQADAGVATEP